MRRAARIDDNHTEIVKAFEAAGATVKSVAQLKGFVDLVVGIHCRNGLVEIKDGSKPPSARKLTEAEQKFHDTWKGSIFIVESIDDVERVLNAI